MPDEPSDPADDAAPASGPRAAAPAPTASTWPASRPARAAAPARRRAAARRERRWPARSTGAASRAPTPTTATPSCSRAARAGWSTEHGWELELRVRGGLRPLARAGGRRDRRALPPRRRSPTASLVRAHRLHGLGHPAAAARPDRAYARLNDELGARHRDRRSTSWARTVPELEEGPPLGPRRPRAPRHLRLRPASEPRAPGRLWPIWGHCPTPSQAALGALHRPLRAISRSTFPPHLGAWCVECGPWSGTMDSGRRPPAVATSVACSRAEAPVGR